MEVGIIHRQALLEQMQNAMLLDQSVIPLQQLALPVRGVVLLQLGQLLFLGLLKEAPEELLIQGIQGVKIRRQAKLEAVIGHYFLRRGFPNTPGLLDRLGRQARQCLLYGGFQRLFLGIAHHIASHRLSIRISA